MVRVDDDSFPLRQLLFTLIYIRLRMLVHTDPESNFHVAYIGAKVGPMLVPWTLLSVASFTKEVNPRLVKRPLNINGRLAERGLTSLVKEATVV